MIDAPFISLSEGATLTKAYRERLLPILSGSPLSLNPVYGFSFSKTDVQTILNQSGTKSLKIYFGLKINLINADLRLVLVAQDNNGDDILSNELLLDHGTICPPNCGADNSLNT